MDGSKPITNQMGKRNTGRKLAMQALYQAEVRHTQIEKIISDYLEKSAFSEEAKTWSILLARETWNKKKDLDDIIEKYAIGWDLDRINLIDKSLLRIGLYEIQFTNTPPTVIINEILEIAKRYSTEDSTKFINGILGNFIQEKTA